jgi:hypothetical protein
MGSWLSLFRLFQAELRVIEMHQGVIGSEILVQEIMNSYFSWLGKSLCCRKKPFKVDRKKIPQLRIGHNSANYWHAGGCAIIGFSGENSEIHPYPKPNAGMIAFNPGSFDDISERNYQVYGSGCSYL